MKKHLNKHIKFLQIYLDRNRVKVYDDGKISIGTENNLENFMKESLYFIAVDKNGREGNIKITYEDNVITVVDDLTGEELFSADWGGNLKQIFKRALDLWK